MRKSIYLWIIAGSVLAACGNGGEIYSPAIEEDSVKKVVNDAVSWQLDNMPLTGRAIYNPQYTGWADGVFFSAVAEWSEIDNSCEFRSRMREIGENTKYEPAPKTLNPANDIAVSMMYMSLYLDERKPKYLIDTISDYQKQLDVLRGGWTEIIPTIERLDYQMKYCPRTDNLDFNVARNHERWCWCDALYMAAPTYAQLANITGDDRYREFMNEEYHRTVEALYSEEDSLFFRDTRFMSMREANGAKVFWGRGNGWVIASLAKVIDLLPEDYYDRDFYIGLYREMMPRLVELQSPEGYWRTSLLDPDSFPVKEMSATGFCAYALWWGINNGLMDESKYLKNAVKAWESLVSAMHPDGKLGYVQPIGDTPENITSDKNEVYGTAALALTGKEIIKYINSETK